MSNIYDALNKSRQQTPGGNAAAAPSAGAGSNGRPLPGLMDPARDSELEALRQRIMMEIGPDRAPVLVFTGAVPGEGATTLAVHFARELAESEQRPVLLVDADLQGSPSSLTGALQQSAGAPGLSELLAEERDPSPLILSTEQPHLHFLPCGGNVASPGDLVRADRVHRLMHELSKRYSCVVIDAGASLMAPETVLLASATDGVILVVRANRTRREVIQKAVHILHKARCRMIGVVLNDRRYPIPDFLYRRI
jgi:capsular exopolysaccharide synthesis family protein